ncbi:MAG: hypothetical protein QM483_14090 [Desulfuromusa sp.]
MTTNLRVGGTHGYQPYREVEPVPAYPRINPQQAREEYPQQQSEQRFDKDDHAQRRFMAMRTLIDELKVVAGMTRVNYFTAETELNDLGLSLLEGELVEQLLELKVSLDGIDNLLQQIRQRPANPDLKAGHNLSEADNFFPVFVAGLSEYNLHFQRLQIQMAGENRQITDSLEKNGRFVVEKDRLRLDFQQAGSKEKNEPLQLDISILVAISEVDEAGRRVILYQRPNQSYALYADKQIDLSI